MNPINVALVTTWGLWILSVAILVAGALVWCHDVNKKLHYILARLEVTDREKDEQIIPDIPSRERIVPTSPHKAPSSKAVSPLVALCIIGAAIIILFVIPIWLINR